MPDLTLDAVHRFWDHYDRRTLYRVIVAIEGVEHWVLDSDPRIDKALLHLGEVMERAGNNFNLSEESAFVRVLASIRASRALRLLQAVDVAKSGSASQLSVHAEAAQEGGSGAKDPFAGLFLKRNLVFERLQLLSRIFAPQRVSLVLKALEQTLI